MRHCHNPDCRKPIHSPIDGGWRGKFCSKQCRQAKDRAKYAARKERKRQAERAELKRILNPPDWW